jgi:hypothetical protein
MVWRKRLLQGLVVLLLLSAAGGYYAYRSWTDSTAVRQAVLDALAEKLPGADAYLAEAHFQLFGGVQLHDLQLTRRDEPSTEPFAAIAEVVLYPDRERLARGELVLRKVELRRPRLTLLRRSDGTCNVGGLLAPRTRSEPLPVVVIQQGTLILVDQQTASPAIEVHDVQATLFPADPLTVRAKVTGNCQLLGQIELEGTFDPDTGEFAASFHLPKVPLGPPLQAALTSRWPEFNQHGQLQGDLELEGDLAYHPQATEAWSSTLVAHLQNGRYQHADLPCPLENLSIVAHWEGGRLVLENLTATAAGAPVQASGEFQSLSGAGDFRLLAKAERLPVNQELVQRLPERLRRITEDFRPEGPLSLSAELRRRDGRLQLACTLRPQGMSATYAEFPYRVDEVTGTLQYSEAAKTPVVKVNLAGSAEGQPVRLTGEVYGPGLRPDCELRPGFNLEITGHRVPINERLKTALKPYPQTSKTANEFDPNGLVSVLVNLQRRPGESPGEKPPLDKRFVLNFHKASMRYHDFAYPVEDIEGTLEIRADESWRFYDFRGRHKGGEFQGAGQSQPGPQGNRILIDIHGANTLLDEEMENALDPEMKDAWRLFNPEGRVNFTARVDCRGKGRPALDLQIMANNCRMKPTCFPYQLDQVRGTFHYVNNHVTVSEFQGRHGDCTITLREADVALQSKGGYRADLHQLRADRLIVDRELLDALPGMVRQAFGTLQPDRPVRVVTDLILLEDAPGLKKYHWDGSVAFADTRLQCGLEASEATGLVALRGSYDGKKLEATGNVQLSQATVARLPLRNLHSSLKVTDEALVLAGMEASVHGGQLYGPVRISFRQDTEYQVDLTASQIDLETLARETLQRSGQVKGKASAHLRLTGRGSDLKSLRGEGSVNIEDGARLYDLPLVLNLLTTLSGHLPKGSAFQEAHADVVIEGDQIKVTHVELLGDALSLRGQGDLNVDGTHLNLEMYGLLWGRTLPLLPPLIDRLPVEVSKQLMKIRIQGSLGDVQVKKEPVPILVEPLRDLWKKVTQRMKEEEARSRRRLP